MGLGLLADDRVPIVFHAVDPLAGLLVIPIVAREAVLGGGASGVEGGVADRGEGGRMPIVGVAVHHTVVHEVAETPRAEAVLEALRHIAAELIDRDLKDELWRLGTRRRSPKAEGGQDHHEGGRGRNRSSCHDVSSPIMCLERFSASARFGAGGGEVRIALGRAALPARQARNNRTLPAGRSQVPPPIPRKARRLCARSRRQGKSIRDRLAHDIDRRPRTAHCPARGGRAHAGESFSAYGGEATPRETWTERRFTAIPAVPKRPPGRPLGSRNLTGRPWCRAARGFSANRRFPSTPPRSRTDQAPLTAP